MIPNKRVETPPGVIMTTTIDGRPFKVRWPLAVERPLWAHGPLPAAAAIRVRYNRPGLIRVARKIGRQLNHLGYAVVVGSSNKRGISWPGCPPAF